MNKDLRKQILTELKSGHSYYYIVDSITGYIFNYAYPNNNTYPTFETQQYKNILNDVIQFYDLKYKVGLTNNQFIDLFQNLTYIKQ